MDLSRSDWYPQTSVFTTDPVTTSSGSRRQRFGGPRSRLLIHYIGAGSFLNRYGDDDRVLSDIEAWARSQKKPNEYNSGSGVSGLSCEYAGPWSAAHSSGKTDGVRNNLAWWGHVVFLGSPEMPTEEQADHLIAGILKTRRDLVAKGWLTPDHVVRPHREAPGLQTGTQCPGPLADNAAWWARISGPMAVPTAQPTSPLDPNDRTTVVLPGEGWWPIARRIFNDPSRAEEIANLNGNKPLFAGDVVKLPPN